MTGTEHSNQSNPKADACGAPTSPTFVQAQPIGTYAIPRTIYIQNSVSPLTVQPTTLDLQGLPTTMRRTPPPRGRWSDAICDWHTNLFPSCYCTCCVCCGIWLIAQISQKIGFAPFHRVLWIFAASCLLGFILQLSLGRLLIIWVPLLVSFFLALSIRLYLVRKEEIYGLSSLGEFCVGFWCWPCSVAQMARHLYGYSKVLDGDGDPHRPDGYGLLV
eukprot:gene3406-3732_t